MQQRQWSTLDEISAIAYHICNGKLLRAPLQYFCLHNDVMITGQQMASICVQLAEPAVTYCLLPRHATSCLTIAGQAIEL